MASWLARNEQRPETKAKDRPKGNSAYQRTNSGRPYSNPDTHADCQHMKDLTGSQKGTPSILFTHNLKFTMTI